MGASLKLEVSLSRLCCIVSCQGPVDIKWCGVVTFDQIGVIAVHGADEVADGGAHNVIEPAPEGTGPLNQFNDKVIQLTPTIG